MPDDNGHLPKDIQEPSVSEPCISTESLPVEGSTSSLGDDGDHNSSCSEK